MARGLLRRLCRDQRGATAVEYGLIVSLIVIAILGGLTQVAGKTIAMWGSVSSRIQAVQTAS